jgi:hypothetical protein
MTVVKKKINDDAELFLAPIPRWVTHYGFLFLLLLFLIIGALITIVRYPEKKDVTVILTKNGAYAMIDFDTYKILGPNQQITVDAPVIGKRTGRINMASTELSHDMAVSKLHLSSGFSSGLIRDTAWCKGEIILTDKPLFSRILNK